jgi:hypothetical protein
LGKYRSIIIIAVSAMAVIGILAYTQLEIYPRSIPVSASREVGANRFFALDKWLNKTGHPVRTGSVGSPSRLLSLDERSVYVQASLFDWQDEESILVPWVREGGSLLISLEPFWFDDEDETAAFMQFLEGLGVQAELGPYGFPDSNTDTGNIPDFDQRFYFNLIEDFDFSDPPLTLSDARGIIRLVTVPLGAGSVTVTGRPYFMYNDNLEDTPNARLSWDLTAAKTGGENRGVFFVRGRRVAKSLFGKLADRGNLLPPALSALALILIGFWMVIPAFGIMRQDDERPGASIRTRFQAEARFLRKYHTLEGYIAVYLREIKLRLRNREQDPAVNMIEASLEAGTHLKYGEIIRDLKTLMTIMERL